MSEGTPKRIFKANRSEEPQGTPAPAPVSSASIDDILSQIESQRTRSPRLEPQKATAAPVAPQPEAPSEASYFVAPEPAPEPEPIPEPTPEPESEPEPGPEPETEPEPEPEPEPTPEPEPQRTRRRETPRFTPDTLDVDAPRYGRGAVSLVDEALTERGAVSFDEPSERGASSFDDPAGRGNAFDELLRTLPATPAAEAQIARTEPASVETLAEALPSFDDPPAFDEQAFFETPSAAAEPAAPFFDDTPRDSAPPPAEPAMDDEAPSSPSGRDDRTFATLLENAERGRRDTPATSAALTAGIDDLLANRGSAPQPRMTVEQVLASMRPAPKEPVVPDFDAPGTSDPYFNAPPRADAPVFDWKPPLDSDYLLRGQLSFDSDSAASFREAEDSQREHDLLGAQVELAQIPIRDFNTPRFSAQPEDGVTVDLPREIVDSSPSRNRLLSNLKRVQEAVSRRMEEDLNPTPLPGQMDLDSYPSDLLRASDRAQRMVAQANLDQQATAARPSRTAEIPAPQTKRQPEPPAKQPEPKVARRQTAVETYESLPARAELPPKPVRRPRSVAYVLFVLFTAVMLIAAIWTLLVSSGVVPTMNPIDWIRGAEQTAEEPPPEDLLPAPKPLVVERDGVSFVTIEGEELILVNKEYSVPENYGNGILPEAQAAFDAMQSAAAGQGISLWIVSGFRSYENQRLLHERYIKELGAEYTKRMSAEAGHSEHQLGVAFDIGGTNSAMLLNQSFKDSNEFAWLAEHAHEYGFILRYPDGKETQTGYMFEPWHFRYVGYNLAHILYDSGLTIEEYVGLAE